MLQVCVRKTAEISDLQDVLVYTLQGVSYWADLAHKFDIIDDEINHWAPRAFFATLTNVNFDRERILALTNLAENYKTRLKQAVITTTLAAATITNPTCRG